MSRFLRSPVCQYGLWLCVAAVFLLPLLVVRGAAVDYFLKIEGVAGESADQDHKDWIIIDSFSHSITKPISGTGANRVLGPSQHSEFVVRKQIDKASPVLFESVCAGKVFPKVEIHAVLSRAGGTNQTLTYEMSECFLSSVAAPGPGQNTNTPPPEQLSLNYAKIEWRYYDYDTIARTSNNTVSTTCSDGAAGAP